MTEEQRSRLASFERACSETLKLLESKYVRAATVAEVLPQLEHLVRLWRGAGVHETESAKQRESMTEASFERACRETLKLLESKQEAPIQPKRCEGFESAPEHLAFMLAAAIAQYAEGRIQKANRWLGFVQGSMHADAYASVEELKRANMPEGEAFEKGKQ